MDCEAAQILESIQEQMVMLSEDPTIKIPMWETYSGLYVLFLKDGLLLGRTDSVISELGFFFTKSTNKCLLSDHLTKDWSMPKLVTITQIPNLLDEFLSILFLLLYNYFFYIFILFYYIFSISIYSSIPSTLRHDVELSHPLLNL